MYKFFFRNFAAIMLNGCHAWPARLQSHGVGNLRLKPQDRLNQLNDMR